MALLGKVKVTISALSEMHDRATDDRTDFSDWYESDHYALWLSDMTDDLVAGRECFGHDAEAIMDRLFGYIMHVWSELSSVEQEAVEAWHEFCEAATINALHTTPDRFALACIKRDAMKEPIRELAKQMAEEKAEAYYWQEVAK